MKTSQVVMKTIMVAVLAVIAVSGCSDKKRDRNRNVSRNVRGGMLNNNALLQQGLIQQNGLLGQQAQMAAGEWGSISGFTAASLSNFMSGAELGRISNGANDSTGIRFRGSISQGIQIIVWDEYAAQAGAYMWEMQVADVQGNNQQAELLVQDSYGRMLFSGAIQGGIWSGQVEFENEDGSSGVLGRFQIYASAILQ